MVNFTAERNTRSNGTIFDLVTVAELVCVIGTLLVVLFTLIKPEASNGLNFVARILFWTLHIGLGLAALWVASRWLAGRSKLPGGTILPVLITGGAAALIAAPGYVALDLIFSPYIVDIDPDPAAVNPLLAVVREFFDLAPFFMATWVLINLPILFRSSRVARKIPPETPAIPQARAAENINSGLEKPVLTNTTENNDTILVSESQSDKPELFLDSLPGVFGTDIIAISSDLHYLNVWTTQGKTTVLGTLKDAEKELANSGMRVHRSHWVANTHVKRVVGSASKGSCILSNDLKIPISRRRFKEVQDFYGHGVVTQENKK